MNIKYFLAVQIPVKIFVEENKIALYQTVQTARNLGNFKKVLTCSLALKCYIFQYPLIECFISLSSAKIK